MDSANGCAAVMMEKVPQEPDPPTAEQLKSLQGFAGELNWLSTRTRPDISYFVSVLSSMLTKQSSWCFSLVKKIHRYLSGTKDQGVQLTSGGDMRALHAWSDAGFAGESTKSQTGLVLVWGGSIVLWRSSRQSSSALSTAEAELTAAAMTWQITEGIRTLLEELGIKPVVNLLVDNQAALAITEKGANWRTRYFAVRSFRIREELDLCRIVLRHEGTKAMVADALTKLASGEVLAMLRAAMDGFFSG